MSIRTLPTPVVDIDTDTVIRAGGGVEVRLVLVGPDQASAWLARNTKNRNFSERTCAGYVRDISADDWPFTGDPVRIAEDGTLLDGQHRLEAIVRTGMAVYMLVITNMSEETQRYMDGGRKRTAADQLAIDKIPNFSTVSAIAKLMILWNPNDFWDSGSGCQIVRSSRVPSVPEVLEFVEQHPSIHDATKAGLLVQSSVPGAKGSVMGAAYMRAVTLPGPDPVFEAAGWFHKLATGVDLSDGHPLLALRRSIARAHGGDKSSGGNRQAPLLFKVIRAWNATRDGESLGNMMLPRRGLTSITFPDMH